MCESSCANVRTRVRPWVTPEVREADGQVPIAVRLRAVHEEVSRAVHGLHAELALVDRREVHVVVIVLVVARRLEELDVEDLRRHDLLVAVLDV